nr:carbohydrate-binding protein [Vibrio owensii]
MTYNGVKYEAKWWTRGDQPDVSSVWTNKGSACQ